MLSDAALSALLLTLPRRRFQGALYRVVTLEALYGFHHNPPYPAVRPLYNLGAPVAGARYTPLGGPPSLYLAEDPDTATAEVNPVYARLRQQNPPIAVVIPPCVLFSVQAALYEVLDLTDPAIQSALQTDTQELTGAWRVAVPSPLPPTQRLGKLAFESGVIQALRYPSAQLPACACYVVFTERLTGAAFIEVFDPDGNLRERLP